MAVRVGMEASGHARWFERLLGELQIELWMGDAAKIQTKRVRKQKTDRQDASVNYQVYTNWQLFPPKSPFYDGWTVIWKIKYVATRWHKIVPGYGVSIDPSIPGYNSYGKCTPCSVFQTYDCP